MDSISKNTQKKPKTKNELVDNMERAVVLVTDKVGVMSIENGYAISVHVFKVNEYHQADLSVRVV